MLSSSLSEYWYQSRKSSLFFKVPRLSLGTLAVEAGAIPVVFSLDYYYPIALLRLILVAGLIYILKFSRPFNLISSFGLSNVCSIELGACGCPKLTIEFFSASNLLLFYYCVGDTLGATARLYELMAYVPVSVGTSLCYPDAPIFVSCLRRRLISKLAILSSPYNSMTSVFTSTARISTNLCGGGLFSSLEPSESESESELCV